MKTSQTLPKKEVARERQRRRTFAIISHPDAGKTTLTEKLLLYSGAVGLAGAVRKRKDQRHATSDWMELEQERGISITSTALQFEHADHVLNLLDTPGHQDFSEDTYRTLLAVDSVIMILDAAEGVERQTHKLFEVCRRRGLPVITFINKLDRPARDILELMDEVEETLGMKVAPLNWPIGDGPFFQGVYDLRTKEALLFERTAGGQYRAPVEIDELDNESIAETLGKRAYTRLQENIELVTIATPDFDKEAFLAGELTPVFFGSALNNFGIEAILDALVNLAPPPQAPPGATNALDPDDPRFTGFVFKIQANMDPNHRDQAAFIRVCSGRFERTMELRNLRSGKLIRAARAHRLFAGEREGLEHAYPGDVVALISRGKFAIGDVLVPEGFSGSEPDFGGFPRFQPEHFAVLHNQDVSKHKQFDKGLRQLESEGAVQVLHSQRHGPREPILAAVGELQFDVVQARLLAEYQTATSTTRLDYAHARWLPDTDNPKEELRLPGSGTLPATDEEGRTILLLKSDWTLRFCEENNPSVDFRTLDERAS